MNEEMRQEEQAQAPEQAPAVEQPVETKQQEEKAAKTNNGGNNGGKKSSAVGWLLSILFLLLAGYGAWFTKDYWLVFFEPAPWGAPYMVTSAEYKGIDITKDGASFKATLHIDIAKEELGWKKIELLPAKVAIIKAELPEDAYLVLINGKYMMLTKKTGKMDASLTFSTAVTAVNEEYSVNFPRVSSITSMIEAEIKDENIEVKVAGAQSVEKIQTNGVTRVSAALPDEVPIQVSWKKALPKIQDGPTECHSETKTLISVLDGVVIGQTKIDFSILHTPTHTLNLNVPPNVSVIEVVGKDVRDWRVTGGKLVVQLEKDVIGPYAMNIKYEMSSSVATGKLAIPIITASGVGREKGEIGVVALSNIELKNGKITNANIIDVKDLPPELVGMTTQPVLLAYRYSSPEFEVSLDVGKPNDVDILLTIIDRANMTIMQTMDGKRVTRAVYNVRNNRNQFLRIMLPKGAELWSASVAGRVSQPVKDESGRILLPLVRSQGGGGMSAFPVEIVYAEEGTKPDEKGRGMMKIELPMSDEPVMHLMVSLFVPEQGKYDEFDGTLARVEQFSAINAVGAMPMKPVVANQSAHELRQVVINRMAVPENIGKSDIEVQLPLSGKSFLLEKILVIKDQQWFSYGYRNLVKKM